MIIVFVCYFVVWGNIRVIINLIEIVQIIVGGCDIEMLLLGGCFYIDVFVIYGEFILFEIDCFYGDFVVIFLVGLYFVCGVLDYELYEVEIVCVMMW